MPMLTIPWLRHRGVGSGWRCRHEECFGAGYIHFCERPLQGGSSLGVSIYDCFQLKTWLLWRLFSDTFLNMHIIKIYMMYDEMKSVL